MIRTWVQFRTGTIWHLRSMNSVLQDFDRGPERLTLCGRHIPFDAMLFVSPGSPEAGNVCGVCHRKKARA